MVAIAAPAPPQIVPPTDGSLSLWVPDQRTFDASRSIIKEYAGLFVYWLRGWVVPERCALPRGAAADRRSRSARPGSRWLLAWINKIYECAFAGAGLPAWLWGLLYRAVDFQSDSWHAGWQAGRRSLRAVAAG